MPSRLMQRDNPSAMAHTAVRNSLHGTVLITGASGFIGRRVRKALLNEGLDVVAIRRPASPEASEGRSVSAEYADQARLDEIIAAEQPSFIFHIAGATKGVTYEDFQRANVMPTENLLRACGNTGHAPERFVFVSSLAAYGPSNKEAPLAESAPRLPIEYYGRSKAEAEDILEASSIASTVLRPGGVFGPGDIDYLELFKMASKGWNTFFGNRERLFSAVYVDDLVDAIVSASCHPKTSNRGYFISDDKPLSWQDFQAAVVQGSGRQSRDVDLPEFLVAWAAFGGELLSRIDGRPRLMNRQKAAMSRQEAWTCTAQAAQRDFGFKAKVDVATGITRAFDWYRKEGWL